MAIIARPAKQGGSTTYQGKVAAGYTKILAAEADGDFGTIYDAWNDGVDAVNVRPNAITAEKIAPNVIGARELADDLPGAILAVDAITARELAANAVTTTELANGAVTLPKVGADVAAILNGTFPASQLFVTPRASVVAAPTYADVRANDEGAPSYDPAKPTWAMRGDYGGDAWQLWRRHPAGAWANVVRVDPFGSLYAGGYVDRKARAGILYHSVQHPYLAGYDGAILFNTALNNAGGICDPSPGNRFIITPPPGRVYPHPKLRHLGRRGIRGVLRD